MRGLLAPLLLGVVLAILLVLPPTLFPRWVAGQVEQSVREHYDVDDVQVRVRSLFGWDLLAGHMKELQVWGTGWCLDGLRVDTLWLQAEALNYSLWGLWRQDDLHLESLGHYRVTAAITEADLNAYAAQELGPRYQLRVTLEPDTVHLSGVLPIYTTSVPVQALGRVYGEGSYLVVEPEAASLGEMSLPPAVLEIMQEYYQFRVDLAVLPFPFSLDAVQVGAGIVLLEGDSASSAR